MEIQVEAANPPPNFKLFNQLCFHEFKEKFVITAVDSPDQGFSIDRLHGQIEPLTGNGALENPVKTCTIYGVAGIIRLLTGTYILLITSYKEVGAYLGFPICQVQSMKFVACNKALKTLTSQEKKDDAYRRNLLKVVEATPGLYYCYDTDITLNFQRRFGLAEERMSKPIWKQADPRFVWNRYLLEELIEWKVGISCTLLGQSQGLSFQTAEFLLKDSPAMITLMSRRCTRRLGTRMWRRGANLDGDTANFVETEQLLQCKGFICSFLQIRGSIPLLWEQIVDLSYKPRLNIIDHEDTSKIVERHFHDLSQRYGDIIVLDLTDQRGDEGQLSKAYAAQIESLQGVRYVSFDFHHYCGNSNLDNLQILYDEVVEDFEKQGYFLVDIEGNVLKEQNGLVRSNCIDCLDRTNVAQSFLAWKSLNLQLQKIEITLPSDCSSMLVEQYDKFKTLWINHGDEIALEYAGTPALKRDLLRYGKQTFGGLVTDGVSALSRYFLNNFQDGVRQDAIDLVSGRCTSRGNQPSPSQIAGSESLQYLPMASALLIGGLTLTSFTLNQGSVIPFLLSPWNSLLV
ncbi:Phosphoinositide phosphatase sac8 [Dionaea muscipula]